ncbi:methyltransferase family protein [Kumtagia ephedrae]|uniref:Isoprenylcysteine carboxylmethyltransferase family protein n=1 Tax=Kumtagia ephedrae TaxID=2116701 RepID=A0A2P7RS91_9HYPH|nr:isoprenylcysteine carboxylmethyltransferase family protein [Mesorhizobium ephedrae]PSJ53087.1 isoprenylcysteine carboxylmethyltransferase family protein [Mesorhizobium ephedrae]
MSLSGFQHARRVVIALLLAFSFCMLLFVGAVGSPERRNDIEMVGVALIVIGIVGRLWCTLYIGDRKAAELVVHGPYSVSRNPLYFFSSIAAAGVGAQTGSITLSFLFFVASTMIFRIVILREERYLQDAFGAAYSAYTADVPRFWPWPARYRDVPALSVSTGCIYGTFRDGLIFFVAMPAFGLAEYLQATGAIPVLARLF